MNTATNLSLALATLLSFGMITGCVEQNEPMMAEDEAADSSEIAATAEAPQALDAPESLVFFRMRFKHTTDLMVQGMRSKATCLEPVDAVTSAPMVQRDCNAGNPGPSDNQSFYTWNPTGRTDGYRMLVLARDPSFCLMIAGYWAGSGGMDNGAAAVLYPCSSARPNQWFRLNWIQPDGSSTIEASHSGRVLNVPGSSTDANAAVYQYGTTAIPASLIYRDTSNGLPHTW